MSQIINIRSSVEKRYADAAKQPEAALCCPVDYDRKYLQAIPEEVIDKDYGCGDPSKWLKTGETVLDLGSGTGKICFIAAQVVGPKGKVIGVDMTDDMLEVARRNAPVVAERIGYSNVEVRKGQRQDLALDLDRLDRTLRSKPVANAADFLNLDAAAGELRERHPLVESDSIDVVVSNGAFCLTPNKERAFAELYRVLKPGGRIAICTTTIKNDKLPKGVHWPLCMQTFYTASEHSTNV